MNRHQFIQQFPDTAAFFTVDGPEHPFWEAIERVTQEEIDSGETILPDLEQVFSSLHLINGYQIIVKRLKQITTHDELMELLTQLYVGYMYRNHGVRFVDGEETEHGYDVELEIADQLLAMGIVAFHDLQSSRLQFSEEIGDEVQYLKLMQEAVDGSNPKQIHADVEAFIDRLKAHASTLQEHPKAHHQVLASISRYHGLPEEFMLAEHVDTHQEEMEKNFPHIAGIVLIDPTSGSEKAHFVPFHGDNHDVEQLLNKRD